MYCTCTYIRTGKTIKREMLCTSSPKTLYHLLLFKHSISILRALLPGRLVRPPECMFGVSSSSAPSFIPRSPTPDICCLFSSSWKRGGGEGGGRSLLLGLLRIPPLSSFPWGHRGGRVDSASSSSWPRSLQSFRGCVKRTGALERERGWTHGGRVRLKGA